MGDENLLDNLPQFDDEDDESEQAPPTLPGRGAGSGQGDVFVRVYFPRSPEPEPPVEPPPPPPPPPEVEPPAPVEDDDATINLISPQGDLVPEPFPTPEPSPPPQKGEVGVTMLGAEPAAPPPAPSAPPDQPAPLFEESVKEAASGRRPAGSRSKRETPALLLFVVSALLTIVLLGGSLLVWAYLTGSLPPALSELLTPNSPTATRTAATTAPSATVSAGASAQPTSTTPPDTATPTVESMPTAQPTEQGTAVPAAPSAGDEITQGGATMVYMPGGTFEMGSGSDSAPTHEVTLSAYYIDKFEVTNSQWADCVADDACSPPSSTTDYEGNPYYGQDAMASYPVIWVSWTDADAFCQWREARLPTEAEWEMAARYDPATGEVSTYPWGDTWSPDRLNLCDSNCPLSSADNTVDDGWAETAPVGSFLDGASAIGVLDMAGNVAEWVADWFAEGYYLISPGTDPTGPTVGTERVVRGGAWGLSDPDLFRSTVRSKFAPSADGPGVGFRCAISADAVSP